MIYETHHIKPAAKTQILSFLNIKPTPQLQVWENCARQFLKKGFILEACIILDIMAKHYGRQMGKTVSERVLNIPLSQRGRGITSVCASQTHPGFYALRDHIKPLKLASSVALRSGGNILLASPDNHASHFLHALAETPTQGPAFPSPGDRTPIHWITLDECLIYTNGSNTLTLVDLSQLNLNISAEQAQATVLKKATLQFDNNIKNICGPLEDGTFFITCESPIPILSDICRLCALDIALIRQSFVDNDNCDIQTIGALQKNILLPNTEQTLFGDCCPCGDHFMTCGGGMQNREVRFIFSDGSWKTKFIHEAPVIRIIPSEFGPVSLDKTGQAFLWNKQCPTDDTHFALDKIQEIFTQNLDETDFTIEWTHKRLYLTLVTPPQASLASSLMALHSCCLCDGNVITDAFVKKIYHLGHITLALMADASIHFWDLNHDCVSPKWQLPQACAEAADWNEVLNTRSPALELDPRIRMVKVP